jgi:hypothetical protein
MPSDSAGVVPPPSGGGGLSLGSSDGPGPSPAKSKKGLIIGVVAVVGLGVYLYAKNKSASQASAGGTTQTLVEPTTTGDSTQSANDAALLAALANGGLLSNAAANGQSQQQSNIGAATAVGALAGGGFLPAGETLGSIPSNPGDLSVSTPQGIFTWITPQQFSSLAPGTPTFDMPVPGQEVQVGTGQTLPGNILPNTPIYIQGGNPPAKNPLSPVV